MRQQHWTQADERTAQPLTHPEPSVRPERESSSLVAGPAVASVAASTITAQAITRAKPRGRFCPRSQSSPRAVRRRNARPARPGSAPRLTIAFRPIANVPEPPERSVRTYAFAIQPAPGGTYALRRGCRTNPDARPHLRPTAAWPGLEPGRRRARPPPPAGVAAGSGPHGRQVVVVELGEVVTFVDELLGAGWSEREARDANIREFAGSGRELSR